MVSCGCNTYYYSNIARDRFYCHLLHTSMFKITSVAILSLLGTCLVQAEVNVEILNIQEADKNFKLLKPYTQEQITEIIGNRDRFIYLYFTKCVKLISLY